MSSTTRLGVRQNAPARTSTLSPTLVLAASLLALVVLGGAAASTASTLASTGLRADTLDDAVLVLTSAVGAAAAVWYAVSAAGLLAASARPAASAPLLRALRRWGAPGLRRAAATALVATSLSFGTSAYATTQAPDDLAWGTSVGATATPSDEAPIGDPPADATPPPVPAATPSPTRSSTSAPMRPEPSATRATPVPSTPAPSTPAPTSAAPISPAPTTTAPTAPPAAPQAPRTAAPAPTPAPALTTTLSHTVVPGDTLWDIARDALPSDASDAEIAAESRRWYSANRTAIGHDPDLIHPGLTLVAPPTDHPEEHR